MNTLILRTSLAALLAASFGLAQAQATTAGGTGSMTGSATQAPSADQVVPGKDMPAKSKRMKAKKAKSEKLEPAGADMSNKGNAAKTGPNATGSAGSGKTP